eukprot:scaffold246473_cov31-Tisochrysis_lutea.AAC.4
MRRQTRGAATATAASTAATASASKSSRRSTTSASASTLPTHSCGEMSAGMRLSHAFLAKTSALNGTIPCQPSPTFVLGIRAQPTKSTGRNVIQRASHMWQ